MRLPFPERISLMHAAVFCLALNALQLFDGTSPHFALCTTLFILISTAAFNLTGGLPRPSGGWIFAYAILVVVFGVTYKAFLGEPGQKHLLQPERTIEVYVVVACMMLLAAFLTRKVRPSKPFFPQFASLSDLGRASTVCFVVGATLQVLPLLFDLGGGSGSFMSAIVQINQFLPLAIILGIFYEIRKSGGKRSLNFVVLASIFLVFASGLLSFSKQGMFLPIAIWVVAAASQRYKVSVAQIAALGLTFAFMIYYLVPYSQYGRDFAVADFGKNLKVSIILLSNLDKVRAANLQDSERDIGREDIIKFYDTPQGFADRLQMISTDDAAINVTENGAVFGYYPTIFAFENLIPHVLWPGKPTISFANMFAHEVGIITDDEDTTTGISFSAAGVAFHQGKWGGILAMLPILLFLLFFMTDACCGDTRESPIALLALVIFLHSAPEGGTDALAHDATFTIAVLYIAAILITRLMPYLSKLVVRSDKDQHKEEAAALPQGHLVIAGGMQSSATVPLSTYRWSKPDSEG